MFKLKNSSARAFLNIILTFCFFLLFTQAGWIQVSPEHPVWFVALVTSIMIIVIGVILGYLTLPLLPLIFALSIFTLGLGLFLITPVMYYFALFLTAKISTLFAITTVWWQAAVIGLAFTLFRFTAPSSSSE